MHDTDNYEIAPKKLPGLPPSKSVPPGPQNPNPVQQAPPNLPIQKTQPPQPTIVSEPNTSVSALLKKQKSNKPKSVTINDEYKKQQSEQSPPKSVGVVGGGGGGVAAKASLFSGGSGGSSDSISIDKEPFRRPLPKGRNKKRASYRKKTEPIPSPATSPKAAPQQQPPPLPPGVGDSQSVPMDASQQQAQPPMAGDFKARQKRTKSVPVPWDQWLKNQQIPDPLISKLAEGGIASWYDHIHIESIKFLPFCIKSIEYPFLPSNHTEKNSNLYMMLYEGMNCMLLRTMWMRLRRN